MLDRTPLHVTIYIQHMTWKDVVYVCIITSLEKYLEAFLYFFSLEFMKIC